MNSPYGLGKAVTGGYLLGDGRLSVSSGTRNILQGFSEAFSSADAGDGPTNNLDEYTPAGEWDKGIKRPTRPLSAEFDNLVEHSWRNHVKGVEFRIDPDTTKLRNLVASEDELRDPMEDVIDNASSWGYRPEDGSVYWYYGLDNVVVVKNPNGSGSAYVPTLKSPWLNSLRVDRLSIACCHLESNV